MKKFSIVILMVLFSVSAFCYEKPFVESVPLTIGDGVIGDWKITEGLEYAFNESGYVSVVFDYYVRDFVVATYTFDRQYNIVKSDNFDKNTVFGVMGGTYHNLTKAVCKIYVGLDDGLIYEGKKPTPFETIEVLFPNSYNERKVDFTDKYGSDESEFLPSNYFVYKIEFVVTGGSETVPMNFMFKCSDLKNVFLMNPKYDGLVEASLWGYCKNGIDMSFLLNVYYGAPSQVVDIYVVAYQNDTLFFFPQWTSEPYKVTLWLPQYTICNEYNIGWHEYAKLPFTVNTDYYVGIAPTGTLNFLNELE